MQSDHHGIGRRPLDRPFPLGYLLAEDGVSHSDRLSRGAALLARRYDADGPQPGQAFHQGSQASGVNAIVVGYEDFRHELRGAYGPD